MKNLKLNTKISLIGLLLILFTVTLLGFYFDTFLKEIYFIDAKQRISDASEKIRFDIKNKESELISGISLIKDDKQMLASISLINNYQDKKNYNAILLDEEKKELAQQLLKRVKISFNSDIVLYDKNEELIVFVFKELQGYKLNFIAYENSQTILYSKYEHEEFYTKKVFKDSPEHSFSHTPYYLQPELKTSVPITFHYFNKKLYIRAHQSIFSPSQTEKTLAHIEMSYTIDDTYFQTLSHNLNMNISMTQESIALEHSLKLFEKNPLSHKNIAQNSDDYHLFYYIKTTQNPLFIAISLQKAILNNALNKNRMELFYFVIFLILFALATLYYSYKSILSQPLNRLMMTIFKIEKGDYSESVIIQSHDELEDISLNINKLAKAVNARESQLLETQKKLEYLSNHDELTGLLNRRAFNEHFMKMLSEAKEKSSQLTLLFIDLDQFKQVNDTLGHIIGDELLFNVTKRLQATIEESASLGRIGGDEFTILLEGIRDQKSLKLFAKKILHSFESTFFCHEYQIAITASIGIAIYPYDGDDCITLSKNADLAMYKSKEIGRNNFSFFSHEYATYLQTKATIINALKNALKTKEEFLLFYQPKISIRTQKVVALEALIRWNSSSLGFVRPDEFISTAEETHMIIELGRWILHQACQDFCHLKESGYALEQISVNLSPIQLQYSNMIESLHEVITQTGILPQELELEVTESYTATNETNAIETLGKFREMGISLAIDDFGTGYSSLSYLQKLPVTRLKIDKAFIDDLPHSKESVAVVNAIVILAKTFNLFITAEGVEKEEQRAFLEKAGCDEIQGYIYSKPLPLEALKTFIKEQS